MKFCSMNIERWKRSLYYSIKPITPRFLQIQLRRRMVTKKAARVRDVWPIDPTAGRKPHGWQGWPSGRLFAFVLTHDVEGQRGVDRCLRLAELESELGFVSSFNFIPRKYPLNPEVRKTLTRNGFEVGVHDLKHDGKLFSSERAFYRRVQTINQYLTSWEAVGFRSGSMYHNLQWMHQMSIEYDASTFDTDPFEPQPDGVHTIFPMWIQNSTGDGGYVELPYTLPQDLTLFILLHNKDTSLWKNKLEWVAERGGMALLVTHPDYTHWPEDKIGVDEYPVDIYGQFLHFVRTKYSMKYWNALPRDVAHFWRRFITSSAVPTLPKP